MTLSIIIGFFQMFAFHLNEKVNLRECIRTLSSCVNFWWRYSFEIWMNYRSYPSHDAFSLRNSLRNFIFFSNVQLSKPTKRITALYCLCGRTMLASVTCVVKRGVTSQTQEIFQFLKIMNLKLLFPKCCFLSSTKKTKGMGDEFV